ncbi:MAG: hypothetical protein QNK05_19505 [Myxococcota bacterium]|nr:hypothetical protein [Myxococcota bacterium]
MNARHYLGMRPGDLDDKPYARFWKPDMSPMQPHVVDALLHGAEASELGFEMDAADQLLEPGYLPLENGFTQLGNGQTLVAVRTEMPGATGAMFEWWMGWHTMEHQRYKLWHPRAHVANGTREMRGDDPSLSDREKYRTTHYVTEYIGDRLEHITITFDDPRTFFGDGADLTSGGTTALVCGRVDLQRPRITIGWLIHQIREREEGTEMRSRFWLGKPQLPDFGPDHPANRLLGSGPVRRAAGRPGMGRSMVVHCGMEMNHLAGFLPELYAVYHD